MAQHRSTPSKAIATSRSGDTRWDTPNSCFVQYAVSGAGWSGHVIAAACFQAEDTDEYYSPSPFTHSWISTT
jgi:hypothetical protein